MSETDELQARIAELEAERDRLADKMERAMIAVAHFTHSYNQDLETIKALRKALEPFAEFGATLIGPNWMPDACPVVADPTAWTGRVCVGHFRKAVDALKPQPTPDSLAASLPDGKRAGNNQ